ncbi:MAG: MoaD/ThiS family protein [Pirellulaceae bacterium]
MMRLKFTYLGQGYDQAVTLPDCLELPEVATVDIALKTLGQQLPGHRSLADTCLVVVSGKHLGTIARHENVTLAPTDELMLIAPVAGG